MQMRRVNRNFVIFLRSLWLKMFIFNELASFLCVPSTEFKTDPRFGSVLGTGLTESRT